MKVVAIQMVSTPQLALNLERARVLLKQASEAGAELAVLPEYFCLMGHQDTDKLGVAEDFGQGPIQDAMAEAAQSLQLWIVAGTMPLKTSQPGRVRNASLVFDPTGRCVARYDKMHLFRFDNGRERYDEARVLERGETPVFFELPSRSGHTWRVGLSVCYDLRFPELYRQLVQSGADLLLVPAAFTHTTGQAHWELLLRARAVENLCHVLASAQGGLHDNGRTTWGHSMVVDPWGKVLGCHAQGEGWVLAELDAALQAECRSRLPALQHRLL